MTNTLPLIGIPCRQDTSAGYFKAKLTAQVTAYLTPLIQAGAVPFLIPLHLGEPALRRLYDLTHGILLTGGGDIDPSLSGDAPHPSLSDVQPERDVVELTLSRWAATDGKPTLGICRGIQVMAVAQGGTLCQDLPSLMPTASKHQYGYSNGDSPSWTELVHDVALTPGSRLATILGTDRLAVNSLHHQAVAQVVEPLQVTGVSEDGVVEVIELPEHPFYCAVQWHPETLLEVHEAPHQIFRAFVEATVQYALDSNLTSVSGYETSVS